MANNKFELLWPVHLGSESLGLVTHVTRFGPGEFSLGLCDASENLVHSSELPCWCDRWGMWE